MQVRRLEIGYGCLEVVATLWFCSKRKEKGEATAWQAVRGCERAWEPRAVRGGGRRGDEVVDGRLVARSSMELQ